jgi:tetratricopeptide (TPR) repeat protein
MRESYAEAIGLAERALAAAPRSPLAHLAKGQVLRAQGRPADAISEYETVLAFNRNWVLAITSLGWCKFLTGSLEDDSGSRAGHPPQSAGSLIGNWYAQIGRAHLLQSRTDEAIFWLEKARNINPGEANFRGDLAAAYALKGDTERAVAELAEARRLNGNLYSSIAHRRVTLSFMVPSVRDLFDATFFTGLRKAGMPEE